MDPHPARPPPPPGAGADPAAVPEPEAPRGSSAAKIALAAAALLVVVLAVVVGGLVWLGAPGVCDTSTIESWRVGYCLAAPGWEYTNEQSATELPYDELTHPEDASSVRILAVEVGTSGRLDEIVTHVRQTEVEEGIVPGEIRDTTVAGVPAAAWDMTFESGDLELQIREVLFLREGTAWRGKLIADPPGFDTPHPEFERILNSWIFR